VGTPKSQLRQYEKELLEETNWHVVREGLEVKETLNKAEISNFVWC
jgi:hypothetical protein